VTMTSIVVGVADSML